MGDYGHVSQDDRMFQTYRFQNPGPGEMVVRVELWCEEYRVAPGSCLSLRCLMGVSPQPPTVEWTPEGLTFWPECFSYSAEIDGVACEQGLLVANGQNPELNVSDILDRSAA